MQSTAWLQIIKANVSLNEQRHYQPCGAHEPLERASIYLKGEVASEECRSAEPGQEMQTLGSYLVKPSQWVMNKKQEHASN